MRELQPTHLISSDLKRALSTAEAVANATGLRTEIRKGFREINIGGLAGTAKEEARRRYGLRFDDPKDTILDFAFCSGESTSTFVRRVTDAFTSHLWQPFKGSPSRIVLVSHGGVIEVILHTLQALPFHGRLRFFLNNASISYLLERDGRPEVQGVNDVRHLRGTSCSATKRLPADS